MKKLLLSTLLALSFMAPVFSEDNVKREFVLVPSGTVKQYLLRVDIIEGVSPYEMAADLRQFLEMATKNSWKIRYMGSSENKWIFYAEETIQAKKIRE